MKILNIKLIYKMIPGASYDLIVSSISKEFSSYLSKLPEAERILDNQRIRLQSVFINPNSNPGNKTVTSLNPSDHKYVHAVSNCVKEFHNTIVSINMQLLKEDPNFSSTTLTTITNLANTLSNKIIIRESAHDYNNIIVSFCEKVESDFSDKKIIIIPTDDSARIVPIIKITSELLSKNKTDYIIYVNTTSEELDLALKTFKEVESENTSTKKNPSNKKDVPVDSNNSSENNTSAPDTSNSKEESIPSINSSKSKKERIKATLS